MFARNSWLDLLEKAWLGKSVVWLSGVRRSGKTCLCQALPDIEYLDCELPRVRRLLDDPEEFLAARRARRVVLDEIHRLPRPAELLKIAADHFPDVRLLATGSSTLGASARFSDTLAGRKRDVWLTPMILADLAAAGSPDLPRRLLHGGLPSFFLAGQFPERDYAEWLDAFWAKDVQELFRLERRSSFQRFVELILAQSGGVFEATRFARDCEISRPTAGNYLAVLEATFLAHVVRPFHARRASEIVAAPRVYAFDSGFVAFGRGWRELRPADRGFLWEHLVLNELLARAQTRRICYWRDKAGHEVDFVWAPPGAAPAAIECKWSADAFDPAGLRAFRRRHPAGENLVVAADVAAPFTREFRGLRVRFAGLDEAARALRPGGQPLNP